MRKYEFGNVFDKILKKEIACDFLKEQKYAVAFKDISPQAPEHVLVIPSGPYINYIDFFERASIEEVADLLDLLACVRKERFSDCAAISNQGKFGKQEVLHFHIHLIGGIKQKTPEIGDQFCEKKLIPYELSRNYFARSKKILSLEDFIILDGEYEQGLRVMCVLLSPARRTFFDWCASRDFEKINRMLRDMASKCGELNIEAGGSRLVIGGSTNFYDNKKRFCLKIFYNACVGNMLGRD
ncbi:HIT domain-containing protein [Candidatus Hydrogenosomobacter endosymbioticus]|uniref:HIT domain-containing protein n=1 Tax=Candidatus Hydrogenosomobacter endosymbioticus TaxID=2558174 RepID=A0ABN6L3E7_9PROT|nr:HIT domain-containing protein [Candidatus Hydrogenosomobacter endosymbioticus]BDB96454.1 hypothetical protein HYD_5870 [Candidatus Hydrogenosomobacter endosymbioticus]